MKHNIIKQKGIVMENLSLSIHRETDLLALARAEKKRDYWQKVTAGKLPSPDGTNIDFAEERLMYWIEQVNKYSERINRHINDFKKINDPVGFMSWIASIVETIRQILGLFAVK